jgi:hypothetical protein
VAHGKIKSSGSALLQCGLLSLLLPVPVDSKLSTAKSSESLCFMVGRGGEQFIVARRL